MCRYLCPLREGCAGAWSRDPFTGCDREGAQSHADIRRLASRCGVTSIGKPTEPVPPSAGAGERVNVITQDQEPARAMLNLP